MFVPLCGKTHDIGWLLQQEYEVAGAELSEIAIIELFDELGLAPGVEQRGNLKLYASDRVAIFVRQKRRRIYFLGCPADIKKLEDCSLRALSVHIRVINFVYSQIDKTISPDESRE